MLIAIVVNLLSPFLIFISHHLLQCIVLMFAVFIPYHPHPPHLEKIWNWMWIPRFYLFNFQSSLHSLCLMSQIFNYLNFYSLILIFSIPWNLNHPHHHLLLVSSGSNNRKLYKIHVNISMMKKNFINKLGTFFSVDKYFLFGMKI